MQLEVISLHRIGNFTHTRQLRKASARSRCKGAATRKPCLPLYDIQEFIKHSTSQYSSFHYPSHLYCACVSDTYIHYPEQQHIRRPTSSRPFKGPHPNTLPSFPCLIPHPRRPRLSAILRLPEQHNATQLHTHTYVVFIRVEPFRFSRPATTDFLASYLREDDRPRTTPVSPLIPFVYAVFNRKHKHKHKL